MEFDYDRLQSELDAEYRIAEYKAKSEALRWVRDKLNGQQMTKPEVTIRAYKPAKSHTENGAAPMGIRRMIVEALEYLPEKFNKDDIHASIRERHPERADEIKTNSMRSVLFKLVQDDILESVSRGGGSALTLYRRGKKYHDTRKDNN
jgi:hypothetical protein